jgi:hypothetical protein
VRLHTPLNFPFASPAPGVPGTTAVAALFIRKVSGMLGLFSDKRMLIAFAIFTAVFAIALLVFFNII